MFFERYLFTRRYYLKLPAPTVLLLYQRVLPLHSTQVEWRWAVVGKRGIDGNLDHGDFKERENRHVQIFRNISGPMYSRSPSLPCPSGEVRPGAVLLRSRIVGIGP